MEKRCNLDHGSMNLAQSVEDLFRALNRAPAITRLTVLVVIMIATASGLISLTDMTGSVSVHRVLGMPVVDLTGEGDGPAWITLGGTGVLVLGGGAGLVLLGFVGFGLLFATGQFAVGLIAFAQFGIGLIFVCAQFGAGLTGLGQFFLGGLGHGWAQIGSSKREFLESLDRELGEVLAFRNRPLGAGRRSHRPRS